MNQTRPSKPPVVLQVIPHLGAGGAEQGCIDVAAELVRAGATSIVVSNGGNRVPELTRSGTIHINLPVHSKNPYIMWRNSRRLRKIIEKNGVDIVHARSRAPAWSAYEACKHSRARFMTTCHAPYNIHDRKLKKFYNSSIARGEKVIAISEHVADYLRHNYRLSDDIIRLIHRGIAPEKFHPSLVTPERMIKLSKSWRIPDGATVILLPGRLTRWKGHALLIEAMSKIDREDLFCVFIGSDQGRSEYHAELEKLIADKGLGERVRIMGHCDDMSAAYMISAIVVSASTEPEGFGRVAVEGQAMGRLVIATDHGGSKETIIPDVTGFLIPLNDADALADKIKYALEMPDEEKYQMADTAMQHVHHNFTRQIMVNKTLDVYAELLK